VVRYGSHTEWLSGYYFPTFRADVLASSGTAAPVVGVLLTYTVAPLHAIRTCAVCRKEAAGPQQIGLDRPQLTVGELVENNVVLCNMFHTGPLMVG
jgi:hypothetical protein